MPQKLRHQAALVQAALAKDGRRTSRRSTNAHKASRLSARLCGESMLRASTLRSSARHRPAGRIRTARSSSTAGARVSRISATASKRWSEQDSTGITGGIRRNPNDRVRMQLVHDQQARASFQPVRFREIRARAHEVNRREAEAQQAARLAGEEAQAQRYECGLGRGHGNSNTTSTATSSHATDGPVSFRAAACTVRTGL
jgi:hypothetical protein